MSAKISSELMVGGKLVVDSSVPVRSWSKTTSGRVLTKMWERMSGYCGIEWKRYRLILFFSLTLTGAATRRGGGVHAGIFQYLDELAAKCADVLFDLIHVVLCDTLAFRFPLLHSDVSPYQISHDTLVPEVSLGSLFHFPLRKEVRHWKRKFSRDLVTHALCTTCSGLSRHLPIVDSLVDAYSSSSQRKRWGQLTSVALSTNFQYYIYFNSLIFQVNSQI